MTTIKYYKQRSLAIPIEGACKEFALEVRRILGWTEDSTAPYLSTRNAEFKTGISSGTISTMTRGGKVSSDIIKKFATGFEISPKKLLQLAGYEVLDPHQYYIAMNQGAICCADGHQTFYGAVIRSPEWTLWETEVANRMRSGGYEGVYDVDECRECGFISSSHFAAFLAFVRTLPAQPNQAPSESFEQNQRRIIEQFVNDINDVLLVDE